ncbi:hypothetical protein [Saccharospirillum sp. MSK14-1]|uniref:hypothetical protein n=1 Tax=Saccharospirillum sp. MSK14-1 TaxID=1897632 RepID=UPI0011B26822|nr:hypothetical protein [Saccharospirillum sp. MSK14-1]
MKKILFLITLLVVSHSAYAESYTEVNNLKVKSVFAGYEEGWAFFELESTVVNPNGCVSGQNKIMGIDPERSDVDQVLSVLLYAHSSGRTIGIQIYNESCVYDHPVIRRVRVF